MAMTARNSTARAVLSMPSVVERIERAQPPHYLSDEQAGVWHGIVQGHPPDWFDAGALPLLTQLCRHVVIANRIAALIEEADGEYEIFSLLKEQRLESTQIGKISTALRITPQSLLNHNGNKKPLTGNGAIRAPWVRHADESC